MKLSLLTLSEAAVKGARLSSLGGHGDRTSTLDEGEPCRNPLPTRARQLLGERVFCFPAEPVTYARKDGHRGPNPSHGRFTKGPRLTTTEARLISVNDPVASTGKSALRRSPRSYGWIPAITGVFVRWSAPSLDASSARHGLACKGELCPERRVSPSWMTSTASNHYPPAQGDEARRFSLGWRNRNQCSRQFSNSHSTRNRR